MVWLEALKAGASATIPMVGLLNDNNMEKLKETLTHYRSFFGLDDASLENMAKDFQVSMQELKANIKSPHLLLVDRDESLKEKLLKCIEKVFSVTGGLLATGLYFRKNFYLQTYFLDTVVSDAKVLLKKEGLFADSEISEQSSKNGVGEAESLWLYFSVFMVLETEKMP